MPDFTANGVRLCGRIWDGSDESECDRKKLSWRLSFEICRLIEGRIIELKFICICN